MITNFKLTAQVINDLSAMYSSDIACLKSSIWKVAMDCCGCSGDCGSNWQQS